MKLTSTDGRQPPAPKRIYVLWEEASGALLDARYAGENRIWTVGLEGSGGRGMDRVSDGGLCPRR